eukprot:GFUD01015146.1.p1 GENE.GFUD01015146.1~~GFUD01015146.1.p1  ORF type:complete len:519 (-),score=59.30 GFUD01015146.1:24-1580(-)
MDNSSGRFLLKKNHQPISLAYQSEGVLVKRFESVPRLKTNIVRSWALSTFPALIRESIIRRVTLEWEGLVDKKNVVQKVWSVLYSHRMVTIELPSYLDEKTRHTIVSYFGSDHLKHSTTPLLVLRTLAYVEELSSIENLVAYSPMLTEVQIRRGATDSLLRLLGSNCPNLQEVNLTCSTGVTDEGISLLLRNEDSFNPCHTTLRHVKLRGTRVRRAGVRMLLRTCLNLEGIRCNTMDVLQALSSFLKEDKWRYDGSLLTMKYMDFSSCYAIFAPKLNMLPKLIEVRIGADVPPQLKSLSRKHKREAIVPTEQLCIALKCLNQLTELKTLVLKDLSNEEVSLVLSLCGKRLKRLDLHYMTSGVSLDVINGNANLLTDLSISDSMISQTKSNNLRVKFLPHLQNCRLMRVTYRDNAEETLLRNCPNIRVLHQEAGSGISNELIKDVVINGNLSSLEEFVINGNCQLGVESVLYLTRLPQLVRFGDIQDWKISEERRRQLFISLKDQWDKKMGYSRNIVIE